MYISMLARLVSYHSRRHIDGTRPVEPHTLIVTAACWLMYKSVPFQKHYSTTLCCLCQFDTMGGPCAAAVCCWHVDSYQIGCAWKVHHLPQSSCATTAWVIGTRWVRDQVGGWVVGWMDG